MNRWSDSWRKLPAGQAGRLDPLCDLFEEEWQAGRTPLLEDYLPAIGEADRPALLDELLALDLDYRRRRDDNPQAEEYLQRLPQYAELIEKFFGSLLTTGADSGQPPGPPPAAPTLPDYQILGELGHGGMGVIYRAVHRKLKRIVALKMILAGQHANPEQRARFRLEAEAIARLRHPNIVQIYEIGEDSGNPFFALEFVEGGTLNRFRGQPQPSRHAAKLVAVLARAMHAAHQAGVVHRDLKPGNVLLSPRSGLAPAGRQADDWPLTAFEPKITDFGLAKQLDAEEDLSRSGVIMGTPSYMAPEQAEGRIHAISHQTDVYSLAAILYDLLTGRPPFKSTTTLDTLEQVRTQDPLPPRRLEPKVPRDLEVICLKGLRKDVRQRYGSALELAADLERFLAGQPILARPVPPWERVGKWTRREPGWAVAVGAFVLALMAGVAGALFFGLYQEQQAAALTRKLDQLQKTRQQLDQRCNVAEESESAGNLAEAKENLDGALLLLDNDSEAADVAFRQRLVAARERVLQKIAVQKIQANLQLDRQRFADRVARFAKLGDQVVFHALSFRDADVPANAAIVRRAAPEALEQLGLDIQQGPEELARGLARFQQVADTPEQLARLARDCCQILLAWSEAEAVPPAEAADPRAGLHRALRLLDAAAALAAVHRLDQPRTVELRRARYHEGLGEETEAKTARQHAAAMASNSTLDLFEAALDHYRKGQIVEAAVACDRVFQREANHFWAQYVAALCHLRQQQWGLALVRLNGCLEKRSDSSWLLMHRALAHAGAGNLPAAEADFHRVLDNLAEPALRALVLTNRSFVWVQQKRWADAERDLVQAIELEPKAPQGHLNLAFVYENQGKLQDALRAIDTAVKRQPEQATPYLLRARLHLKRRDAPAARCDLERVAKGTQPWAEAMVSLARLELEAGQNGTALADIDAVLQARPDFAPARRQRAEVLLRLEGRQAEAAQELDLYLTSGSPVTPEIHQARGLLHHRGGKYSEAVESFSRALGLQQDAETYSLRGWAYLAQEASRPALADFDAALELKKKHPDALRGRATALFLLGRALEGEEAIETAIKEGPRTPESLFQAACTFGLAVGQRRTRTPVVRYAERATVLLEEALRKLPGEAERGAFWQQKVEKSAALAGVRGNARMQLLAGVYGVRR